MVQQKTIINLEELAKSEPGSVITLPEYERLIQKAHEDYNDKFTDLVEWFEGRSKDPRSSHVMEKLKQDLNRAKFLAKRQKEIQENGYALPDGTVIQTIYQLYERLKEFIETRDGSHNGALLYKIA